jgi:hypothetical protein
MFFALKLCTLFTCPNGFDPISSLLLKTVLHIISILISERGVIPIIKTIPTILQVGRKGLASTSFNLVSNIQHPVQSGFYNQ